MINYIRKKYKDETKVQVKIELKDSIEGLNSISAALKTMHSNMDNKNISVETNRLTSLLTELMYAFDGNKIEVVEIIMNDKLTKDYNIWKSDIENEFR
ncbi:hypothetical protein [Clostridium estertheticum]|uniref:hypothetical protein n=1 Tax=Clostridium estertheticum TaxID=238834 RepID=UPI001CF53E92|nr:hypothetical protein [Clostridium estertheticum]MCB2356704.1 hypothetical protein [Clostridium estertheticum]WAG42768.1 hypothetical protein LL065_08890 [Clostridium estertheticum]